MAKEKNIEGVLQIPATITKVVTMSHRSVRLTIDSQEEVGPDVMSRLMDSYEKIGWFCFLAEKRNIKPEEIANLPEIKDETDTKSPSQRLRGVLFIEWGAKSAAYKEQYPFEVYYRGQMEKIIEVRKEKLA